MSLSRKIRRAMQKPQVRAVLSAQREDFIKKFGREPTENDPVFYDPDLDVPTPMDPEKLRAEMIRAMVEAEINPALIHAYEKTGMVVSEHNKDQWSKRDMADWDRAIDEYYALTADEG